MYKSKFKSRAEAQEYYNSMLAAGRCTPKFKEHYARVFASLPESDDKINYILFGTLPIHTAIPIAQDSPAKANEIIFNKDGSISI